jgi:hypothetical protein
VNPGIFLADVMVRLPFAALHSTIVIRRHRIVARKIVERSETHRRVHSKANSYNCG